MGKKLVSFLAALLLVSIITFLLIKCSSADPAENYLRVSKIMITPEALENAKHYLGLNKSWIEQYFIWLGKAITGDFGLSYVLKVPVLPLVLTNFLSTLILAIVTFVIIIVISIPLGLFSALYKNSFLDKLIQLFSFSSVSMPTFWIGYLLMIVFGVYLKWLPVSGKTEMSSIVLPSLTLSLPLIGQYTAVVRKSISEQMEKDYVTNAILRGVSMKYIIVNHLLRNALPAIATGLNLTFVYLMTGSLIVEEVFAWGGIGSLFVHSVQTIDVPVIQASMILFALLFLINNIFIQRIVTCIDPRMRKKGGVEHV